LGQLLLIDSILTAFHAAVCLLNEEVPGNPVRVDDVLTPASTHNRRTANEDCRVFISINLKVGQVDDVDAGIA
jgi:hypothetical protein